MTPINALQNIRNNKLIANGRLYVGAAGVDPVANPGTVFTDYAGTNSVSADSIVLDINSQPVIDGQIYSTLYVDTSYSIQIITADNVELFTPQYISVDV